MALDNMRALQQALMRQTSDDAVSANLSSMALKGQASDIAEDDASSSSISSISSSSGISHFDLASSSGASSQASSVSNSPYLLPQDYDHKLSNRRSQHIHYAEPERSWELDTPLPSTSRQLGAQIEIENSNHATSRRRPLRKRHIQQHAAELVRREAQALLDLAARLEPGQDFDEDDDAANQGNDTIAELGTEPASDAFARAIDIISSIDSHGKVIISGVGKSGLLAKKAVATFNSLGEHISNHMLRSQSLIPFAGIPSVFLHPVEALHGDMGVVSPHGIDIVILISYSGRTLELVTLGHALRRKVHGVISITTPGSAISQMSDITLDGTVSNHAEADHTVPAPTSSVMVALALLDSLALSALRIRTGWHGDGRERKQVFALHHPGGSLGQQMASSSAPPSPH